MSDLTRAPFYDALAAAVAAGEQGAVRRAAQEVLDAETAAAERAWACPGRLARLAILEVEWAAILLSGRGPEIGRSLWARHTASSWEVESYPPFVYLDALYCSITAGVPDELLPLDTDEPLPADLREKIEALEAISNGLASRDRALALTGVAWFEARDARGGATGVSALFTAAVRAVVARRLRRPKARRLVGELAHEGRERRAERRIPRPDQA